MPIEYYYRNGIKLILLSKLLNLSAKTNLIKSKKERTSY